VRRRVLHGVGGRFDFTHDRIREVAYRQLLQPRRKILHLLVANALEGLNAGSLTLPHAALAGHYHAAEVWERALTHFRQAGAEAMRLSAYREAMTCFEQALEALAHLPETRETLEAGIDLRLDLRHALHPLGEGDRIRESLRDAEGLARKLDDRRRLGWISAYMAHYFRMAGHSTEAVRLARTAQRLGETLGDSFLRPRADLHLGTAYLSLGDYRRAEDLLRRVVQSLDDDRSRGSAGHEGFPAVLARAYRAQSLAELGQFKEGVVCGEEGIWIAEALDHPMSLASVCSRLGHLHAVKGELDRAAVLLERGRALTRDWEITFTAALVTGSLGYVYVLLGRVAEGLGLLRDAIDAYESMRVEAVKARLLVHLGEAYLLTGRLGDADVCAARSLAHTRERGERGQEAHALRLLGEIAAHRDPLDVEAAEDRYREAMTLAAELGMRPLIARCHHGLGTLYRRAGETHIAREHLAAAETLFSQMEMKSWLAKAAAELAALR
jgi:tetratricopeptide (TPR) repeat protein